MMLKCVKVWVDHISPTVLFCWKISKLMKTSFSLHPFRISFHSECFWRSTSKVSTNVITNAFRFLKSLFCIKPDRTSLFREQPLYRYWVRSAHASCECRLNTSAAHARSVRYFWYTTLPLHHLQYETGSTECAVFSVLIECIDAAIADLTTILYHVSVNSHLLKNIS